MPSRELVALLQRSFRSLPQYPDAADACSRPAQAQLKVTEFDVGRLNECYLVISTGVELVAVWMVLKS